MLKRQTKHRVLCVVSCLLTACVAPSIQKQVLHPPREEGMKGVQRIAVLPPDRRQTIDVAALLEGTLANIKVNNQNYFTVIDRRTIQHILNEQKFSEKGIADSKTAIKLGKLVAADTLMTASLDVSKYSKERYKERRLKCQDKKCEKTIKYSVRCTKGSVTVNLTPKATDTVTGALRYSKHYSQTRSSDVCEDSGRALASEAQLRESALHIILQEIKKDVAPYAIILRVPFMTGDDSDMPSKVEKGFEAGLDWLSKGRYDHGCRKMKGLLAMHKKSPAILYNNGVCEELNGNMDAASILYRAADSAAFEANRSYDEINRAINRIGKKSVEISTELMNKTPSHSRLNDLVNALHAIHATLR